MNCHLCFTSYNSEQEKTKCLAAHKQASLKLEQVENLSPSMQERFREMVRFEIVKGLQTKSQGVKTIRIPFPIEGFKAVFGGCTQVKMSGSKLEIKLNGELIEGFLTDWLGEIAVIGVANGTQHYVGLSVSDGDNVRNYEMKISLASQKKRDHNSSCEIRKEFFQTYLRIVFTMVK